MYCLKTLFFTQLFLFDEKAIIFIAPNRFSIPSQVGVGSVEEAIPTATNECALGSIPSQHLFGIVEIICFLLKHVDNLLCL